jgi:membrane peptidoglycan carboxypeptidase
MMGYRTLRYFVVLLLCCTVGFAALWEARTSDLQSWFFHRWSSTLRYSIESAPNPQIAFPRSGPFDERRGYTGLPKFIERLKTYGFHISAQASQTPQLAELIHDGIAPPYREPPVAGLVIRDSKGAVVFNSNANARIFQRFEQVPSLLAETLLFIENRSMGDGAGPRQNPAIDWQRSSKAALFYGARKIGLDAPLEGGSTLATQLNKYRHSSDGRTITPADKLRQIVGASLAAYQEGRDTRETRKQIVVDYLNTMPLSAAPGVGDVHGLGDGLRVWFNMDLTDVCAALQSPGASPAKARAYRHVLALLYAVHAPTYYLITDHRGLESRIDAYAELLRAAGILDSRLAQLMKTIPLEFTSRWTTPEPPQYIERKAINAVRIGLSKLLGVDRLYDSDRLDLQVDSTIDTRLQDEVTRVLRQLGSPDFVATHGLVGPRLLTKDGTTEVTYSFLLLESRPEGNLVRVRSDTLNAPFDINGEMKLELGSTAKLRTLAHYLDVMAQLYDELSPLDTATLEQDAAEPGDTAYPRDTLTRWAAGTLLLDPSLQLESFLNRALDRRYSASPAEVFFTGGGIHTFGNFDPEENDLVMSVRDALVHSTNLVFIRLMRDLVRFHAARLPYDERSVLASSDDPARRRLLTEIGDKEAQQSLAQTYRHYRGLRPPQVLQRLLGSRTRSPRDLALVF